MSNVTKLEASYNFRTQKDTNYKRPQVVVEFDVPTAEGLVALLQGDDEKVRNLLTDTIANLLTSHVRTYVDADLEFDQAKLDALVAEGKISLEAIANLPKSERNSIGKEDLEQFRTDYVEFMPAITGKDIDKVKLAAEMLVQRFKPVAGKQDVLEVLAGQLAVFADKAPEEAVERNLRVISYLADKAQELMSVDITAEAL